MLELDDLEDRPVNLDVVAVFELVGAYQGESVLPEPKISMWLPFRSVPRTGRLEPNLG
jgi:hypothetical protein